MEFNFTPEEIYSSKVAFLQARSVYDEMVALYDDVMANKAVCAIIDREIRMPQLGGKDVDLPYKVMLVIFIDLIKCYQNMGHSIDFNNKDSFLLPMVTNLKFRQNMTTEIEFKFFMELDYVEYIYKNLLRSFEEWAKTDGTEFLLTRFTKEENPAICNKYIYLMLVASDYIKWATPTSIRREYEWTAKLRKIIF